METDLDDASGLLEGWKAPYNSTVENGYERRLISLSRGIAEIIPSGEAHIVQFIHQSVQDFCIDTGLHSLGETHRNEIVTSAHSILSQTCLQRFKDIFHSNKEAICSNDVSTLPFVRYATESLAYHMQLNHWHTICS